MMRFWIIATFLAGCANGHADGPPSVILVSLDTLRADRLGAYGNTSGLTPNLDHFAKEAIVFSHAYAQAPETLFSQSSLFTGRYPSELGALDLAFQLPEDVTTMAEAFYANGYTTMAAVAGGYLAPEFRLGQGFEIWNVTKSWGSLQHTVPVALRWVDEAAKAPFLLLVHGYDTHTRYLKPPPFGYGWANRDATGPGQEVVRDRDGVVRVFDNRLFETMVMGALDLSALRLSEVQAPALPSVPLTPDDLALVRGVYDGATAWADAWFGELMAGLSKHFDSSIIVVYSDHGEELGEQGRFGHGTSLEETVIHVPLMIRLPNGVGGGQSVADVVELVDVLPTLCQLTGIVAPAGVQGSPLLDAQGQPIKGDGLAFTETAFRSVGVRSAKGQFTFNGTAAESPYMTTLLTTSRIDGPSFAGTGIDPEEGRATLLKWRSSLKPSRRMTTSAEDRAKLQQDGYWRPQ